MDKPRGCRTPWVWLAVTHLGAAGNTVTVRPVSEICLGFIKPLTKGKRSVSVKPMETIAAIVLPIEKTRKESRHDDHKKQN